ncbi:MAG TPA: phosphoenolpyruvate--protein phosphotransferase [Gemmatimonadales bacterium]|nr:phosphoenolpyruvate--protein phosphotransferase [Gemmatimonadales bacterium]
MGDNRLVRGIGVSPGVAFGPALVVRFDVPDVPNRAVPVEEVEHEVARLREAVNAVVAALEDLRDRVRVRAGAEESRIFDAQIMMAQDAVLLAEIERLIRDNHLSAETAYEFKSLEIRNLWGSSGNAILRDRLADLSAIQTRMLHHLLGKEEEDLWSSIGEPVIVVAHELSPGLTVQLDREHVAGLVSEEGTKTSHAAILAHSLGIPAVMGATGALKRINPGALVMIDGQSGTVLVDPTMAEQERIRAQISRRQRLEFELEAAIEQPGITPDGRSIMLMGNVDLPEEIESAARHRAQGVGLLRTEFLLVGRAVLPTEQEQTDYFLRVASAFPGQPIIIRSFDLGGDKFPAAFRAPPEANPFLGWRSIRVCLDQPEMFRVQLRAVLRAAADRPIQLMLPLVTRIDEVTATREILAEEAEALTKAGVRVARELPIGVMIETPAAVLVADHLAQVSSFFSIGSNDLVQYTLAVDRGNARLAHRFTPHHPAILRQLTTVLAAGNRAEIPVSVCGEMASDPLSCVLLIGMGYTRLSVAPPALALVKWIVRAVPYQVARQAAQTAMNMTSAEEVTACLHEAVRDHIDLRLLDGVAAKGSSD